MGSPRTFIVHFFIVSFSVRVCAWHNWFVCKRLIIISVSLCFGRKKSFNYSIGIESVSDVYSSINKVFCLCLGKRSLLILLHELTFVRPAQHTKCSVFGNQYWPQIIQKHFHTWSRETFVSCRAYFCACVFGVIYWRALQLFSLFKKARGALNLLPIFSHAILRIAFSSVKCFFW